MNEDQRLERFLYNIGETSALKDVEDKMEREEPLFSAEYLKKKEDLLNEVSISPFKRIRRQNGMKGLLKIAAAAVVLVVMSAGVYAATKFYNTTVEKDGDKLSYQFDIDYELTPYEIEVTPGYVPTGYEDVQGGGKYYKDGDLSNRDGFSIYGVNAALLKDMSEDFSINNVIDIEETTLAGTRAHVVETQEWAEYNQVLLFFEEEGYLVTVYGAPGFPMEELKKVADGIESKVTDVKLEYSEKNDKQDTVGEITPAYTFANEENIYSLSQKAEIMQQEDQLGFTVTNAQIIDNISDLDENKLTLSEDEKHESFNPDGTVKEYERMTFGEDGKPNPVKSIGRKLLAVDITVKNHTDTKQEAFLAPFITQMKKSADGNYDYELYFADGFLKDGSWPAVGGNEPLYNSAAENLGDAAKSYYFRNLNAGEELQYQLIFVLDEDQNNIYLQFNSGDGDSLGSYVDLGL